MSGDGPEHIHQKLQNIMDADDLRAAKEWAIDLARIIGQTDPCPRCDGTGAHIKHRNCGHAQHDAWILGCNERVICKRCGGSSRVMKPLASPSRE